MTGPHKSVKWSNWLLVLISLILGISCTVIEEDKQTELRDGFKSPPLEARPRALWDWVDGNFSLEEITFEMEEAKRMGLGGFDIWDVRSVVDEDSIMPAGPPFMSDEYLSGIVHAINEAERLDLDLGLIIASGWNAGGTWTLPQHQTMGLYSSELNVKGPAHVEVSLPFPELPKTAGKSWRERKAIIPRGEDGLPLFYKDIAVLAIKDGPEDELLNSELIIELGQHLNGDGIFSWEVPEGSWILRRYVCTNTGQPMISSTPNSVGPMIDHFSAEAGERHIRYFIDRLEEALGKPIAESGLDYFYTDSYEVQGLLWSPEMAEEFEDRMGYSLLPYIPALEGRVVDSPETTSRFLYDFRLLLSDLIIENHYTLIREICEENGVGFVAEAAGPGAPVHNCPFESLKSSGSLTVPRGEFWHVPENSPFWQDIRNSEQGEHFLWEIQVIKGVASAAHLYDQKYVEAEAFTGIHLWNEGPGDLKATADRAFCEGLNRINFHTWPHTPEEAGAPGWAYAFGTLINDHRIWWPMAGPFIDYLGRCSYLLQQGNFVGDVLYYYGDSAPNFVPAKRVWPELGFGYDYDVCNSDILLNKLEVEDGKLVLPHGQEYELLVLPRIKHMQPEVLERISTLVDEGAWIVGPKPERSHGLYEAERRDKEVRSLAEKLWKNCDGDLTPRVNHGLGKVHWGPDIRGILEEKDVLPDLAYEIKQSGDSLDYIHRDMGGTDIYFIRNVKNTPFNGVLQFRQTDKMVELWDPATGKMYGNPAIEERNRTTHLPLSLEGGASVFVVFDPPPSEEEPGHSAALQQLALSARILDRQVLDGPWEVEFPEESAGAGVVVFDTLLSWNRRAEDGIRFFSGIATYRKEFTWDQPAEAGIEELQVFLDMEDVVEIARVRLNGKDMGIAWFYPFRVEISEALETGTNLLEIEVANTWHNGLAGDARLPAGERRLRTNVRRLPNAWIYPMESIPSEEYDLIDGGLTGEPSLLLVHTRLDNNE